MPVSDYHQISDVLHVLEQCEANRVLDVGVGFGKWGVLCREVLDVYHGRLHEHEWTSRIEGVEIFEAYRNPLWDVAYDRVHIGDVQELIDDLGTYDVVLICDVIEHFEKEAGLALLRKLLAHAKVVIVTSPRGYYPQGTYLGNEHEEHKAGWEEADFQEFAYLYKDIGFTFMAVLSSEPSVVQALSVRRPLDVLGFKKGVAELLRLAGQRVLRRASARASGATKRSERGPA